MVSTFALPMLTTDVGGDGLSETVDIVFGDGLVVTFDWLVVIYNVKNLIKSWFRSWS